MKRRSDVPAEAVPEIDVCSIRVVDPDLALTHVADTDASHSERA